MIDKQTWARIIYTESTCGEACWCAHEDVCRCSCGGKNHGIMRAGERPERTRKLNGYLYQLVAVELPGASCIAVGEEPLRDQKRQIVKAAREAGLWEDTFFESVPGYPAKIKTASEAEVKRWPELAAFRNGSKWWRPATLWVRVDMAK